MENGELLLSKGKFMGLYYGQCVAKQKESTGNWMVSMQLDYSDVKLELKKIENLTHEDVTKIPKRDISGCLNGIWTSVGEFLTEIAVYGFYSVEEVDYLRSMGYAIPWMTFTIEQQVANKWITLIE